MTKKNLKVQTIPLKAINDPEIPIRSKADEEGLRQLARSIRDVGLIQPILVKPKGDYYEVIAGHRRFTAFKMLQRPAIPAIVYKVNEAETDALKLHENLFREDVSEPDQARLIRKVMKREDLSVSEMADRLKRSESFIRSRLNLLEWPSEIIEAVEYNKISFTVGHYLSKITDPKLLSEYLHFAIEGGITSKMAKEWADDFEEGELEKSVETQLRKNEQTGEEEVIPYVTCQLCGGDILLGNQKVIFVHKECIRKFQRMAFEGKERRSEEQKQ